MAAAKNRDPGIPPATSFRVICITWGPQLMGAQSLARKQSRSAVELRCCTNRRGSSHSRFGRQDVQSIRRNLRAVVRDLQLDVSDITQR
jgi:hypothetical protein